jgi:adenylate cyclase
VSTCTIKYGTGGRIFEGATGARLLDVILANEPTHRHVCGGNGFCTSCQVQVEGDLSPPSRLESERLGSRCGPVRLACQSFLTGDVTVVPLVHASLVDWE